MTPIEVGMGDTWVMMGEAWVMMVSEVRSIFHELMWLSLVVMT